jgi:hypothetical protein
MEIQMRRYALLLAFLIGCTAVTAAPAQTTYADDSPPMTAGRIAVADGDVQIWRAEEESDGQWDAAQINDVVSIGTGLHLGRGARTEVRVGPHAFRLGPLSRGGFTQLDYGQAVFDLEHGVINVRLAIPQNGETYAVTAAGMQVDLAAPGRYRIETFDRGGLRLTAFDGQGTVRSGSNAVRVGSGQALAVGPDMSSMNYETATSTAFDDWALARDDSYRSLQATRYVSSSMTGYEELDQHGDWMVDTTYGAVWYPRAVPVGWAPYRFGQWRWVRPWGWTWVDHAPWGFAPFHYGRWVMIGARWCWWPGGYIARPVWAPALVGFVGGGGAAVAITGPVVGWYPLAPWHHYRPHYRHGNTYVTIINRNIIQHPPRGVPPNVNRGGGTMVPGPRFRDPVMKVALPTKSEKLAELQPVAPPPRTITAPKAGDSNMVRRPQPVQAVAPPAAATTPRAPGPMVPPPKRVVPPMAADPVPGRGVASQPALPGNDPAPLSQPPKFKRVEPKPAPAQPAPPNMATRPQPRPNLPTDQLPPGQKPRIPPAEPARFPPDAPPTIKQPTAPPARAVQPSSPPARTVQPSPSARAVQPSPPARAVQPSPSARAVQPPPPARVVQPSPPTRSAEPAPRVAPAPASPPHQAPRAEPRAPKEQVVRSAQGGGQSGHGRPEREAPAPRMKQAER